MVTPMDELSPEQLSELTRQFIEVKKSAGMSDNTLRRYSACFQRLLKWLSGRDFTQGALADYVDSLGVIVSPASMRTICAQMFSFTRWLYREGYTSGDFAWGVRERIPEGSYSGLCKTVMLCPAQELPVYRCACDAVLQLASDLYSSNQTEQNLQSFALVSVLRETGIRGEELVQITGDDLLGDHTLRIRGSNARTVRVKQSGSLLSKLRDLYWHEELFRNRVGEPASYGVVRRKVSTLAKNTGVSCTMKMFRIVKTAELIQSRADYTALMEALGISYTTATLLLERYKGGV